ncbi:MFS transporter [Kitasatospora sp. NPDC058397]|uniref:MFS transporter n=1 Tax=unclassified Kitasatospora TaxID=2633591 RepID=UPI0036544AF1
MSTSSAPAPALIPPAGPQRTLAAAQLASAVGDGAYYTCSALYFTHVVGMSATALGAGLAVAWALGSLAGVPLGALADRRGPRRTAVALALATAVVVAAFLVIRSYGPFLVAVCLYATTQSGLTAARQALVATLVPPAQRTGLLAHLQSTLNGGLAVGAAIGGIALTVGTRAAFLCAFVVTALGFLAGALILLRLPEAPPAPARSAAGPRLAVLRDRRYAAVALVNTVLLLRMPLLSLVIPLWIADRAPGISWLGSALFVLNTLAVLGFQVRAARGVTGLGPAARAVRSAGVVLLASCAGVRPVGPGRPGVGGRRAAGGGLRPPGDRRDAAVGGLLADQLRPRPARADRPVPGLLRHRRGRRPHPRAAAADHPAAGRRARGLARPGRPLPGGRVRDGAGRPLGRAGPRPGPPDAGRLCRRGPVAGPRAGFPAAPAPSSPPRPPGPAPVARRPHREPARECSDG